MRAATVCRAALLFVVATANRGVSASDDEIVTGDAGCTAALGKRVGNVSACDVACQKFGLTLPLGLAGDLYATSNKFVGISDFQGAAIKIVFDFEIASTDAAGFELVLTENTAETIFPPLVRSFVKPCSDVGAPTGKYFATFKDGDCSALTFQATEDACPLRKQLFVTNAPSGLSIKPLLGVGDQSALEGADCVPFVAPNVSGFAASVLRLCDDVFPDDYKFFLPRTVDVAKLHSLAINIGVVVDIMKNGGNLHERFTGASGRDCLSSWINDACTSFYRPCTEPVNSLADIAPPCQSQCDSLVEDCLGLEDVSVKSYMDLVRARMVSADIGTSRMKPEVGVCLADGDVIKKYFNTSVSYAAGEGVSCAAAPQYTYSATLSGPCNVAKSHPDFIFKPEEELSLAAVKGWKVAGGCALTCPFVGYSLQKKVEDDIRNTSKAVVVSTSILGILGLIPLIGLFFIFPKEKLTHPKNNLLYMSVCAILFTIFGPVMTWLQGWEDQTCANEHYEKTFADGGACVFTGFATYYFSNARLVWWTLHAVDLLLIEVRKVPLKNIKWSEPVHHAIAWGVPALFAFVALGNEKYGYSESGTEFWCTFGKGGVKSYFKGEGVELRFDETSDGSSSTKSLCSVYGTWERWSGIFFYKYLLTGPCLLIGGCCTMAVLFAALRGDYIASLEEVEKRASKLISLAQERSSKKLNASPSSESLTLNDEAESKMNAVTPIKEEDTEKGNVPSSQGIASMTTQGTPEDSSRRLSSRRRSISGSLSLTMQLAVKTEEEIEDLDEYDIIGAKRYMSVQTIFGTLWRRKENYYAKFAFVFVMWTTQMVDFALAIQADINMKGACETFVANAFDDQANDDKQKEQVDITLNEAVPTYFRLSLLCGVGVLMFITGVLTSENFALIRKRFFPTPADDESAATKA